MTRPVFDSYCIGCHSAANRTAGLSLDALSRAPVGENLALWEKVTRRLQARVDPPRGAPRPDDATYRAVVSRLEAGARRGAHGEPDDASRRARARRRVGGRASPAFLWNGAPDAELLEAARRGELRDPGWAEPSGGPDAARPAIRQPGGHLLRRVAVAGQVADRPARPGGLPAGRRRTSQAMDTETRLFLQSQLREDRGRAGAVDGELHLRQRASGAPLRPVRASAARSSARVAWPNTSRGRSARSGRSVDGPLPGVTHVSDGARHVRADSLPRGRRAPSARQYAAAAERPGNPQGTMRERMMAHKTQSVPARAVTPCSTRWALRSRTSMRTARWRTTDGGSPIDASGTFIDGTRFNGPAEFRAGLLRYRDAYYAGVTRQLLAYALNRKGKAGGSTTTRCPRCGRSSATPRRTDYRWSSLLRESSRARRSRTKTSSPDRFLQSFLQTFCIGQTSP